MEDRTAIAAPLALLSQLSPHPRQAKHRPSTLLLILFPCAMTPSSNARGEYVQWPWRRQRKRRQHKPADAPPEPPAFPFTKLPPEIRVMIWKATVGPRTIRVSVTATPERNGYQTMKNPGPAALDAAKMCDKPSHVSFGCQCPKSTMPVPAGLHVCRESRATLKSCYDIASGSGVASRYLWVNFEQDTIFFRRSPHARTLEFMAHECIQRFKLHVGYTGYMLCAGLREFPSLVEGRG